MGGAGGGDNVIDKGAVMPEKLKTRYVYKAEIPLYRVYDGDTVRADIDLGLGVWVKNQTLRLYGIDTPEVRGEERPEGLEAKEALIEYLEEYGKVVEVQHHEDGEGVIDESEVTVVGVVIRTHKDRKGKYGRWLCEIIGRNKEGKPVNINRLLVENGFAEKYNEG